MARIPAVPSLTPGQAQYVLERLVGDRRIAPSEVAKYVAEMRTEIADIERRLTELRAAAGGAAARTNRVPVKRATASRSSQDGDGRSRKRRGNRLAGSYMGYMRQVRDDRKKEDFKALKSTEGYERAIAALRKYLGK